MTKARQVPVDRGKVRARLYPLCRGVLVLSCGVLAFAAGWVCGQELLPVQDVRLPLSRYPDGSIHQQLFAASATMSQTGPIRAKEVRVETFDPEGELEMVVESVQCDYDRTKGTVTSTDAIKAKARGMTLTGIGFDWDVKGEQLRVLKDVRLEFNREKATNRKTQ